MLATALAYGVLMTLSGVLPTLAGTAAVLVAAAMISQLYMTATNSYLPLSVAESVRGRVMGLYTTLAYLGDPISSPLLGLAAEHWGGRAPTVIAGATTVIAAVGAFAALRLRARWLTHRLPAQQAELAAALERLANTSKPHWDSHAMARGTWLRGEFNRLLAQLDDLTAKARPPLKDLEEISTRARSAHTELDNLIAIAPKRAWLARGPPSVHRVVLVVVMIALLILGGDSGTGLASLVIAAPGGRLTTREMSAPMLDDTDAATRDDAISPRELSRHSGQLLALRTRLRLLGATLFAAPNGYLVVALGAPGWLVATGLAVLAGLALALARARAARRLNLRERAWTIQAPPLVAVSTPRSRSPNASPGPARCPRSAVSARPTTTPWPNRSSGCSRPS